MVNNLMARSKFKPTCAVSSSESVAEALRRSIIEGRLPGGARLKQNDIAVEYNVSPGPVREAFNKLAARGLVTQSQNRGVTVTLMSTFELDDVFEQRSLLEPHALTLSSQNLSAEDLNDIEAVLDEARNTLDHFERVECHWMFHRLLYAKANRRLLLTHIETLYDSIARYLYPIWATIGVSDDWIDSHLEIVALLRRGKLDRAVSLLTRDTQRAANRIRKELHRIEKLES